MEILQLHRQIECKRFFKIIIHGAYKYYSQSSEDLNFYRDISSSIFFSLLNKTGI